MRRLNKMTYDEVIDYNLRDGGTAVTIFADAQPDRVNMARQLIRHIIEAEPGRKTIWELGCSAGDISGFFSEEHEIWGIDVVPAAVEAARARYPKMTVLRSTAEDVIPTPCDILVLTEFLEHVVDPISVVKRWGPLAGHMVIGHPLVGDGSDPEEGHVWAYEDRDFIEWFEMAGHEVIEAWEFPVASYRMVIGRGRRTS